MFVDKKKFESYLATWYVVARWQGFSFVNEESY